MDRFRNLIDMAPFFCYDGEQEKAGGVGDRQEVARAL